MWGMTFSVEKFMVINLTLSYKSFTLKRLTALSLKSYVLFLEIPLLAVDFFWTSLQIFTRYCFSTATLDVCYRWINF